MDHKVSKDMISSGMTPSGEKTQADLGRTQYGSAPSPSKLMDAYKSMYEHHKKDADGNTIPHEGEELNEFLSALVTGAGKLLTGLGGKALASKAAGTAAKVTTTGGKMIQGAPVVKKGLAGAVDKFKNMSTADKFQTYMMGKDALKVARGGVNAILPKGIQKNKGTNTVSADAALFDIVKGQLLDEGLSEEEIKDIMLTLTPDEILNEMGMATPESGTGKYYDEKNPTPKQKEIQKNLPQNRKPTPDQQAARDKYAKIKDMTNKGDHQGASKLYNS